VAQPLAEATAWLADYRQFWEESYQRLDVLREELQAAPPDPVDSNPRPDR